MLSRHELTRLTRGGRSAHAVEMSIARLRDSLGAADVVRTVVKRGYRLAVTDA
ncbi:hypothetical protein [Microbacterium sp. KUDC0406]|uniref:hypothetical protein n=1 Tax=Microbacterium sp. KUDC0406 TaxID=2909588 RepID=UPI002E32A790|nr:hypothetical protein [Microbacterium sp. KUDC0406]